MISKCSNIMFTKIKFMFSVHIKVILVNIPNLGMAVINVSSVREKIPKAGSSLQ